MIVEHVIQLTGSACAGKNCLAAVTAMLIRAGGGPLLSADQVRTESGRSCVPGVHTPSGGLVPADAFRVAAAHDVDIVWLAADEAGIRRLLADDRALAVLGDYGYLPAAFDAQASFTGDHAAVVAGDLEWHDPLQPMGIAMPWDAFLPYAFHFADEPVTRATIGAVKIKEPPVTTVTITEFAPRVVTGTNVRRFTATREILPPLATLGATADGSAGIEQAPDPTVVPHGPPGSFLRLASSPAAGQFVIAAAVALAPPPPAPAPDCTASVETATAPLRAEISDLRGRLSGVKAKALSARHAVINARNAAVTARQEAEVARLELVDLAND